MDDKAEAEPKTVPPQSTIIVKTSSGSVMYVERNAEEKSRNLSQKIVTKSAGLSSDVVRKSSSGSMLLGSLFYFFWKKSANESTYFCVILS